MSRTGDYGIKYIEDDDSVDVVTDMNGNFEAVSNELDGLNDKMGGRALAQHKHNLSSNDFTGTLPVNKGGTGNTSIDSAPTSGSTKMVTSGGVYTACRKVKSVIVVGKDCDTLIEALKLGRSLYYSYGVISDIYCIGVTETISESVATYFGHLYLWDSTITISRNAIFFLEIGGKIEGGKFINNGSFRVIKDSFFEYCSIETNSTIYHSTTGSCATFRNCSITLGSSGGFYNVTSSSEQLVCKIRLIGNQIINASSTIMTNAYGYEGIITGNAFTTEIEDYGIPTFNNVVL